MIVTCSPSPCQLLYLSAKISPELHHIFNNIQFPKLEATTIMSLRNVTRAIPRSMPRTVSRCPSRTLASLTRPSILQQTCRIASIPRYTPFSTERLLQEKEGQGEHCSRVMRNLIGEIDSLFSGPRAFCENPVRARYGKGSERFRKATFKPFRLP